MFLLAFNLLVGCQPQDTSFTSGDNNNEVVTGSGKMTVSVEDLVIADLRPEFPKSGFILLDSVGDSTLKIYEISIVSDQDGVFFTETPEDAVTIDLVPGDQHEITVIATLMVDAPSDGELRVRTSDSDFTSLIIPLHAYPQGYVPPEDTGADSGSGT